MSTPRLCCGVVKAATDGLNEWDWCVPRKHYLQKQVADWIWPTGHRLLGPALSSLSPLHHVVPAELALVKVAGDFPALKFSGSSILILQPKTQWLCSSTFRHLFGFWDTTIPVFLSCHCGFFSCIFSPSFFSSRHEYWHARGLSPGPFSFSSLLVPSLLSSQMTSSNPTELNRIPKLMTSKVKSSPHLSSKLQTHTSNLVST